ncbi:hypothetical protein V6N13_042922 [Hibiscus sabdariffa]
MKNEGIYQMKRAKGRGALSSLAFGCYFPRPSLPAGSCGFTRDKAFIRFLDYYLLSGLNYDHKEIWMDLFHDFKAFYNSWSYEILKVYAKLVLSLEYTKVLKGPFNGSLIIFGELSTGMSTVGNMSWSMTNKDGVMFLNESNVKADDLG